MTFLPTSSLAQELVGFARDVRDAHRDANPTSTALAKAIPITECHRGDGTILFTIPVGNASRDEALDAFTELARRYPCLLDLLTRSAHQPTTTIQVEISQAGQGDLPRSSAHDRSMRLPRLLARFRGVAHA